MSFDRVQWVAIAGSAALIVLVIDLVRRRRLVEEYALLWIGAAALLLVVSIWRDILHTAARALGVFYPPSVLLMALIVGVFLALLWFSVVLSRQRRSIERLTQETAVLAAEIRDLRGHAITPDQRVSRAPEDGGEPSDQ